MVEKICKWIVAHAGLNVEMANQYLEIVPTLPDRPDLEQLQREHEAEIVAKDKALALMQAAIEDLDRRLRRSDPIVAQAISQDQNSVTYGMVKEMFARLQNMDSRMKVIAAGGSVLLESAKCENCGHEAHWERCQNYSWHTLNGGFSKSGRVQCECCTATPVGTANASPKAEPSATESTAS